MRLLFYFNGFNSAIPKDWSDNEKIIAVEEFAKDKGYRFLPTTVNYRSAERRAREILARPEFFAGAEDAASEVVFSGSSMGGWYARVMQLLLVSERPRLPCAALAFNPAFDLGSHGHLLLGPQTNFVTGENYEWTERDSARLASLEASVPFDAPLPFYVYADRGDEVIDCRQSEKHHAPIAHFRAFEGGSHGFEHAREALEDFAAARRRETALLEPRRTTW